jgi:hypothetical protein
MGLPVKLRDPAHDRGCGAAREQAFALLVEGSSFESRWTTRGMFYRQLPGSRLAQAPNAAAMELSPL